MAVILDGKMTGAKVKEEVKNEVLALTEKGEKAPCLAVIIVGDNPASKIYVNNKKKACDAVGFTSLEYELKESTTQSQLLDLISKLNGNSAINGILVQLPLPAHINEQKIIEAILPEKDVDAFHPSNVGKITLGLDGFLPCTPAGIMRLLAEYKIDVKGKNCVVIGRSNIVGKPAALLLLRENGTVTVCHSKTKNLSDYTKRADIIICAVGKANFLTADMVSDGVVIVDVGMNRSEGKLCGDADFEGCEKKASYITPVPGGVGPMTISMLMKNTLYAYKLQNNLL